MRDEFSALKVSPAVRKALRMIKREVTDAYTEALKKKDAEIRKLKKELKLVTANQRCSCGCHPYDNGCDYCVLHHIGQ